MQIFSCVLNKKTGKEILHRLFYKLLKHSMYLNTFFQSKRSEFKICPGILTIRGFQLLWPQRLQHFLE